MSDVIAESHKTGIGGSNAAPVLGLSRFKTAHDVYAEVHGLSERKPPGTPMRIGKALENLMRSLYEEQTGAKGHVPGDDKLFRSDEYSHMIAHPDYLHDDGEKGAEFKVAGQRSWKDWGDPGNCEVPQEYYIQCLHYMIVTKRLVWDMCVIVGTEFRIYPLKWSEKLATHIIRAEKKFWEECVIGKKRPPIDERKACETLMKWLHPISNDELLFPRNDDEVKMLDQYAETHNNFNAESDNLTMLKNQVKDALKENQGFKWDKGKITWKTTKAGNRTFRFWPNE